MELLVRVVTIVATLPVALAGAASASVLTLGLGVLLSRRAAIFRTTLRSAWWWTLAALLAWSGIELAAAVGSMANSSLESLRLAAISLSLCPVVALLGAKRPQVGPWNFVVLSLWGILALPAAEALFLRGGQGIVMGVVREWFLWVLILLGPINFVPTRYWLPAVVLALGQMTALCPQLALVQRPIVDHAGMIGLLLSVAAMVVAWFVSSREAIGVNEYDRMWLDFRDRFGLLWGLRVQERVNAAAKQYGWDLELTWSGFRRKGSDTPLTTIDPEIEAGVRATLKGLLRRFEIGSDNAVGGHQN